jgi:hypothetical protein
MLSAEEITEYLQDREPVREKKPFSSTEARQIGDTLGVRWDTFDVQEFTIGLNVELEHGRRGPETDVTHDDPMLTGKIALAHLDRIPDYYARLAAIEYGATQTRTMQRRGVL